MKVAEPRTRALAEEKLIVAARDLLAEVGPRATSVRSVAARAGVNHGLVHHYFGSKEALLREGMKRLVHEHAVRATERAGKGPAPAPLGLLDDTRYLHAVLRCILDGEMELARTELDEGVSIPRAVLETVTEARGTTVPDVELKAVIGLGMAIEMGWAAVEPFFAAVAEVSPSEMPDVRARAISLRNKVMREFLS